MRTKVLSLCAAAVLATSFAQAASAASLTVAGISQGFSLSTFVSSIPSNGAVGPVGITFLGSNSVMISSYATGLIQTYTDVDGQTPGTAVNGSNFGGNNPAGLANLNGTIYVALQGSGRIDQLNSNGTFNHQLAGFFPSATGLVADAFTGHLYVSEIGSGPIFEVDPVTGLAVGSGFGGNADGLTLSSDGSTLYAEINSHILGFNTTTHNQVFDSGFIPGGADGVAFGSGSLAGQLFVNTNSGQVIEVDETTSAQTVIVTGGSRGDFVSVDPFTNTLLLTQTDSILRLTPPSNGGFVPVPLPAAVWSGLALLGAVGGLSFINRRRIA